MTDLVLTPDPRPLGKSGLPVSADRLGHVAVRGQGRARGAGALVDAALAAGVTLFDTADIYGFDGRGGSATPRRCWARSSPRARPARPDGAGHEGRHPPAGAVRFSRAAYLPRALDASLRRLGVEQARPVPDPPPRHARPPARTGAHARGRWWPRARSRAIGVSNYTLAADRARWRRYLTIAARDDPARILAAAPRADDRRPVRPGDGARHGGAGLVAAGRRAARRCPADARAQTRGRGRARCGARTAAASVARGGGLWLDHGASGAADPDRRHAERRRASPRSPTPTASAGPRQTGTTCWSPRGGKSCRERAAIRARSAGSPRCATTITSSSGVPDPLLQVELGALPRHRAAGRERRVRQYPAAVRLCARASTPPRSPPRSRRCTRRIAPADGGADRRDVAAAAGAPDRDDRPDARRAADDQHHLVRHARRDAGLGAALSRARSRRCRSCETLLNGEPLDHDGEHSGSSSSIRRGCAPCRAARPLLLFRRPVARMRARRRRRAATSILMWPDTAGECRRDHRRHARARRRARPHAALRLPRARHRPRDRGRGARRGRPAAVEARRRAGRGDPRALAQFDLAPASRAPGGAARDAADEGYAEANLWTGIGRARSGAGAAIVGDPDQVLAKLQRLSARWASRRSSCRAIRMPPRPTCSRATSCRGSSTGR